MLSHYKTGSSGVDVILTFAELFRSGALAVTEQADPITRAFIEELLNDGIEAIPQFEHVRQEITPG
jgi:hypothetical protein